MSAALDEDTAQTLASGRDSLGAILSTLQSELQKVFMLWVVGFLGMFSALRLYIWEWLRDVTVAQMDAAVAEEHEIIVTTPFEVILLQAKIGIIFGILICLPVLVYLSRRELKARGRWPDLRISRPKLFLLGMLATLLFIGGLVYAYSFFFPIMFDFLATQAINVGVAPTYGIVQWTEFLILLTLSFGLAANLPLAMTALSYAGIVKYETFRDKWKWAVLGIFAFGALFSPPDPFTQIMWAAPLVGLYGISLALAKIATNIRRAGESGVAAGPGGRVKQAALSILLLAIAVGAAITAAVEYGVLSFFYHDIRPILPTPIRPTEPLGVGEYVAAHGRTGSVLLGLYAALIVLAIPTIVYVVRVLRQPVHPPINPTNPSQIDLTLVSAERIRTLPEEVFTKMEEDEAVDYAQDALDNDDPEKAEAIFARFDGAQEASDASGEADDDDADDVDRGVVEETTAGVLSSLSDDGDEEEFTGYLDDIKFVVGSLRSRLFHMFAVFMVVLAVVFTFLYQGGLGWIKDDFIERMPHAVTPEELTIIALHPVEVLIFIVKFSTLFALLAVLPMILYYAWPAMSNLGWISGKRDIVFKWTAGATLALAGGTALGYFIIGPAVISFLVYDAQQAGMIISYRIDSFAWLIIFLTAGIGLLALIPFTMWMLYLGNIASYRAMRNRWREVTITAFVVAGMFTPAGVLTMFIVGIPVMIFYWVGLAGLWLVTLGGRRGRFGKPDPA